MIILRMENGIGVGRPTLAGILYHVQEENYFKSGGLPANFREFHRIRPEPPLVNSLVMTIKETAATSV
jgi:hypothetical protein